MQSILLILLCQFSLDPSVIWELPEPEKGGDTVSPSSVATTNAATSGEATGEGYYVVMYTAGYCPPCRQWKNEGGVERMRQLGHPITLVDIQKKPQYSRPIPCFEVIERGTGRVVWTRTGYTTPETIVANVPADKPAGPLVSRPARTTHTSAGVSEPLVMQWNFRGDFNPSTAEMIDHLSEHGVDATGMTRQEMAATHDRLHNGYSTQAACPTCPQPQLRRRGGRFFGLFGR